MTDALLSAYSVSVTLRSIAVIQLTHGFVGTGVVSPTDTYLNFLVRDIFHKSIVPAVSKFPDASKKSFLADS